MIEQANGLIVLRNGGTEVGVLPRLGGRVVLVRRCGGNNILKVDPSTWPRAPRRHMSAYCRFVPHNGHIVWLGPQSQWWAHQRENPSRRRRKAVWPPDPHLEYANYRAVDCTGTSVRMRGPVSRFTGIELTKTVKVDFDGTVDFSVKAVNTRRTSVTWDLWLNTRVDGNRRCYVPVGSLDDVRVEGKSGSGVDTMPWRVGEGFFTFDPQSPSRGKRMRAAKAFIYPATGVIATFTDSEMLLLRFKRHRRDQIHPEQGLIEIFNMKSTRGNDALLELEYHAPYRELAPGESMSAEQIWEIHPYAHPGGSDGHAGFVRRVLEKSNSVPA